VQAGPALACHLPGLAERLGLVCRTSEVTTVALTFDDGPHPLATPRVLAALDAHGAQATFFLVGEQVCRHPGLAAEIAAAGHTIGLHGNTHRCELWMTAAALRDDWARGRDAIHAATGGVPKLRRPPYGALSGLSLVLARRAGLATILWSRWARDWRARATPASITAAALGPRLTGGEIVLLHDADHYAAADCWRATVNALPSILRGIDAAGLRAAAL
jgi:peptidoglycan/xylan/chitin deacetylase (PgdA/CDA1 family)